MSLHLHSSKRRPEPLKDTDYDHEIRLVDHTKKTASPSRNGHTSKSRSRERVVTTAGSDVASDSSSRRHSDVPLRKPHTSDKLRKEISKRKYRKYQDRREVEEGGVDEEGDTAEDTAEEEAEITESSPARPETGGNPAAEGTIERGRKKKKEHKEPETAIDILYENQRGLFLCGIALFSSSALGNLDPSPWTNIAHKTSATNITNAQVPDPSWEWVWKEWSINRENDVGEDGWEYSFAFSKKFSWHGRAWYNSFVRRRAWIRKRAKKHSGYESQPLEHRLNSEYFTIHPAVGRNQSRDGASTNTDVKRFSADKLAKREMEEIVVEDICDIPTLMHALKVASIDREKLETVENFIENGGDELHYLQDHMHNIMKMFIFQASRKILVSHLHRSYDELSSKIGDQLDGSQDEDDSDSKGHSSHQRRLKYLSAALERADDEVKKLEFWSDVKDMAESGETKHGVDGEKWDGNKWEGIDDSAPKDVISKPHLAGDNKERRERGMNGDATRISPGNEDEIKGTDTNPSIGHDKGKGKEE